MQNNRTDTLINPESSLKAYFHDAIERASDEKHLDAGEHTLWYLTNLLHTYTRSEKFFDYRPDGGTLTPLALYYQAALEATTDQQRRLYLQRLGDVAIFITGVFARALDRRSVGVSYYTSMGENAYGYLADLSGNSTREKVMGEVFTDLSNCFSSYVAVLSTVAPVNKSTNQLDDLMQMFNQWQATADPDIEQKLRQRGVILNEATDAVTH